MESEKESDKLIGKKREAPKKNDKNKNKSNKKQKQKIKKKKMKRKMKYLGKILLLIKKKI